MAFPEVSAYPDLSIDRGGNAIVSGNGSIGTSESSLVAANVKRVELHVTNTHATQTVSLGATGLAAGDGITVLAGASVVLKTTAEVFAIASGAATTVGFLEITQG